MHFNELGLREELLRAITELGFEDPMPIQAKAIPPLLEAPRDLVGLAQTGTGKTGAYGLALLQKVDPSGRHPVAVILSPTRELCLQITEDLKSFARFLPQVKITAVYGGAGMAEQIRQLKRGTHIVVATPGRLCDLLRRRAVTLASVHTAILDEADEMLNMGFKDEIDAVFDALPDERRVWLFSATMAKPVANVAARYLKDPLRIQVSSKEQGALDITHTCYLVHEKHRYHALKRIMDFVPDMYGLIFCRTRTETQHTAEALMQDGYQADALHGDLSQSQREYVMRKFRQRSIRVLVATDVAARGLDVDDLTHVLHYRLPDEPAVYTHRSGRTGRAGKSGASVALINTREKRKAYAIEDGAKLQFAWGRLPTGRAICEKQLFALVNRIVADDGTNEDIDDYLPAVLSTLAGFDREELIKRFVSAEVRRFLDYYRHADDIKVDSETIRRPRRPQRGERSERGERGERGRKDSGERGSGRLKDGRQLFLSVGLFDNINKGAIVRLICDEAGISSRQIGAINLRREFSFVEVEADVATKVVKAVSRAQIDGRSIRVSDASKPRGDRPYRPSRGRPSHRK